MAQERAIPHQERLILALDVDDADAARRLVDDLGDAVHFYKVGLQLFLGGGGFQVVDWLRELGKRVFLDLKLYDVPRTVAAAVGRVRGRGVRFLTVHGDAVIMKAAIGAARGGAVGTSSQDPGILAVTVLTSLDARDLVDLGFGGDVTELVVRRAGRALEAGCEGVIASGREAPALREAYGDRLRLVLPGIRDAAEGGSDDQKRTVTVEEAFARGADYVVVGRPIRGAVRPREAAERLQGRIAAVLG